MVALKKYTRIEATGLWRASDAAQRREVIVVLGDATLTIKTISDQPLAHWSIAAIERINPGKRPALYRPDGDPGETLELPENEGEMIDALETLRRAVARTRPHPGRLRWVGFAASALAVIALAVLWVPRALLDHTVRVVPQVGRAEIGQALLDRIERISGPTCGRTPSHPSLERLRARLDVPALAVARGGFDGALHLPGGLIVLSRQLVEDYDTPEVAAGYILAERVAARDRDALHEFLEAAGLRATFRLLTTGSVAPATLDRHAEAIFTRPSAPPSDAALLRAFAAAEMRSTPYARARDITGESTLALIEGDPGLDGTPRPVLSDASWLRLQAICSG